MLNAHNQAHDVNNLFVTDGACMASSSNQNPSITYMALTARAVDLRGGEHDPGRALMASRREVLRTLGRCRSRGRAAARGPSPGTPTG